MNLHAIEPTRPRRQRRVDGVESLRLRADADGKQVASVAWSARNLISTQVHESWKIHIGAADLNATMAKVARENEELFATDVEPRKLVKRDRSVAYSR